MGPLGGPEKNEKIDFDYQNQHPCSFLLGSFFCNWMRQIDDLALVKWTYLFLEMVLVKAVYQVQAAVGLMVGKVENVGVP